jgi:thioredoxin 1
MKSKWPVLLLALVVAGVIIAKQMPKKSGAGAPEATEAPTALLAAPQLSEALDSGRPTVVDFGKNWCKPCKAMAPVLQQVAADYKGKANIVFVDLERYAMLGDKYKIATMPTQIFFDKAGKEATRHIGFLPKEEIDKALAALGAK